MSLSFAFVRAVGIVLPLLLRPATTLADTRAWQPLILEGRQLGVLVGRPAGQIEVLAQRTGKLESIPFQIDERSADRRFSFPSEHQAPSATKGLGPYDQIAMMVSDLGHVCDVPGDLPPGTLEISLFTPSDGTTRYAYIATVEKPRLSPKSYVDYDGATDHIETDCYRLTFVNGFPADFALQADTAVASRKYDRRFSNTRQNQTVRTRASSVDKCRYPEPSCWYSRWAYTANPTSCVLG